MLNRNCGIKDIQNIFKVSKPYILKRLIIYVSKLEIKPQKAYYESLQIDEFWTYVGSKKKKVWLLYTYSTDNQEVVAYVFGDRSEATVAKLYDKLVSENISVGTFYTDNWKAFRKILPKKSIRLVKSTQKPLKAITIILGYEIEELLEKLVVFLTKWKTMRLP